MTLLADRGFVRAASPQEKHGELLRLLSRIGWHWAIRVKSDLNVTLATGLTRSVENLFPPAQQAYLFRDVTVLDDIECHLATAQVEVAKESWAVLSSQPPSVKTFALYGQRFGGIEPHFKDYKSAAFHVLDSGLRNAQALTCLFMLLDSAYLIAIIVGMMMVQNGQLSRLDWHGQRGLSFLQLGLREIARLSYERLALPILGGLPSKSPPKACASRRKRVLLEQRIEFSKVVRFS